ncbi:hypothetical protein D3C85_875410 [compost metagenome]
MRVGIELSFQDPCGKKIHRHITLQGDVLAPMLHVPRADHAAPRQGDEQLHDVGDNLFEVIARNQDAQIGIVVMR